MSSVLFHSQELDNKRPSQDPFKQSTWAPPGGIDKHNTCDQKRGERKPLPDSAATNTFLSIGL